MLQTEGDLPKRTELVLRETETRAARVTFDPVGGARAHLEALVALYRASRTSPAPLIGKVSFEYAEHHETLEPEKAIEKASAAFDNQLRWDKTLQHLFRSVNPFEDAEWADAFRDASLRVYAPLLEHRSKS